MCMNYRKLNNTTKKDHFLLLFIDQILDRLVGKEYYCFGRVLFTIRFVIKLESQEKTIFTYPYGKLAFKRMPLGLRNAPNTFERCMMAIFTDMVEDIFKVFMGDFLVFWELYKDYLRNLKRFLERCKEMSLVLK